MAVSLEWLDHHETILVWRFTYQFTAEEFYRTLDISNKLVEQKPYNVYIIIDMLEVGSFPTGILTHAANALSTRRPNSTCTIVVMKHPTLCTLYNTFIRIHSRLNPHYVNDLRLVSNWATVDTLLPAHLPTNHNTELSYP